MANLNGRLARVETAVAGRRRAEIDAALAAFDGWCAGHWTAAEASLWVRCLLSEPVDDAFFARLTMTRAEAEVIKADYPPLAPDEVEALRAALLRVPAELRARLGLEVTP
jgi:hypothetical protein